MTDKIGKSRHNIGEEGIDSIRIAGMPINSLDMVPLAHAKLQMAEVRKTQLQNKINGVKEKYPKQKVSYLESRIKECGENVVRIRAMEAQNNSKISEYVSLVTLCEIREKEIARIPEDAPDRKERVKEWQKRVPPYKVDAMKQQMLQFQESIDRCVEVIAQEYASIAEFNEILGLCKQRDTELKNLGE